MKDKDKFFLDIAYRCSLQGTCLKANYGAVIVDADNHIVSTGYTGMPSGVNHCEKCGREGIPSGTQYEKCRSVHAEMNALLQAGKEAYGCTIYLNKNKDDLILPCYLCAKMIVNGGIISIITPKEQLTPIDVLKYWEDKFFSNI